MTLREKLSKVSESEIFKLVYYDKVIGFRVKSFNINTDEYEYYDFHIKIIASNDAVKNFITGLQNMRSLKLKQYDTLLMTEDEINGSVKPREFKDEKDAIRVLEPFVQIYKYKNTIGEEV